MFEHLAQTKNNLSTSVPWATFQSWYLGLKDGLNPCALATLLVFQLFIRFFARDRKTIFRIGLSFIVSAFVIYIFLVLGAFDRFLSRGIVHNSIFVSYLILAVIFVAIGVIHFVDWVRFLKKKDVNYFLIQLPSFLTRGDLDQQTNAKNEATGMLIIYFAFVLGSGLVLLASIWPPSANVFLNYYLLTISGKSWMAFLPYFFYSLGYVFWLLIIWLIVLRVSTLYKLAERILASISLVKIIFSSIFLSVGIGLLYFFLA